jgi:hypothetical protein
MVEWRQSNGPTGSGGGGGEPHHLAAGQQPQPTRSTDIALPSVTPVCRFAPPPHQQVTRPIPRPAPFPEARMELMNAAGTRQAPAPRAFLQPEIPCPPIAGARHAVTAKLHPSSRCCHTVLRRPQPSRDRQGAVPDERNAAAQPDPPRDMESVVGAQPKPAGTTNRAVTVRERLAPHPLTPHSRRFASSLVSRTINFAKQTQLPLCLQRPLPKANPNKANVLAFRTPQRTTGLTL